jgi:hypothetical protein
MSNTTKNDRIRTIAVTAVGLIAAILVAFGVLNPEQQSVLSGEGTHFIDAVLIIITAVANIIHLFTKSIK